MNLLKYLLTGYFLPFSATNVKIEKRGLLRKKEELTAAELKPSRNGYPSFGQGVDKYGDKLVDSLRRTVDNCCRVLLAR